MARSTKEGLGMLVEAPVSRSAIVRQTPAMIAEAGSGLVARPYKSRGPNRVVHRELLNPAVTAHSSFTVESVYPIQPGLASSFPWVSTIGANYEQYTIHTLKYHFVPFVATSTAGTIMMMVDYNAQDPQPTTETQFMDHPKAVSAPIWEPFTFVVDVKEFRALGTRRYIRPTAVAGDLKTFDLGRFYIASDNSITSPCGKLYVEYDIEFFTPQLEPSTGLTPVNTSVTYKTSPQAISKNTATPISFSAFTTANSFDPLGLGAFTFSSTALTPPAGCYRVCVRANVSDDTAEANVAVLYVYKNNVVFPSAGVYAECSSLSSGGTANGHLGLEVVVPCNGTDVLTFMVNMTGAAGVLNVVSAQLLVSLA